MIDVLQDVAGVSRQDIFDAIKVSRKNNLYSLEAIVEAHYCSEVMYKRGCTQQEVVAFFQKRHPELGNKTPLKAIKNTKFGDVINLIHSIHKPLEMPF